MLHIETGDQSLAVPLNLHAFACPSRSNKRYALTQQSRRKLLVVSGFCLLSSEGISVRLHPPAFTNRRLSVGYKSIAVFVTAFYSIGIILCLNQALVKSVFFIFPFTGCTFRVFRPTQFPPCFPFVFLSCTFLTNRTAHVIFSDISNAMTMLRIPHRFQRAGGCCEPAAGRKCGLPSEQNG